MWLSRKLSQASKNDLAEKGSVTLSNANEIEAGSTISTRSINTYSPYGYSSVEPVGEEVLLIPSSDGQVCVGSKTIANNLESGEVQIMSLGGAKIVLKNDGSVVINSLVIDKDGEIKS